MKRVKLNEEGKASKDKEQIASEVTSLVGKTLPSLTDYSEVGTLSMDIIVNEIKRGEFHSPLVYHPEEGVFSPLVYQLKGIPLGKDFLKTPYAKCVDTFSKKISEITLEVRPQERRNLIETISRITDCFDAEGSPWLSIMPILTSPPKTSIKTVLEVSDISFYDSMHSLKNKTRQRYEHLRHVITNSIIDKDVLKDPDFIHSVTPLIKRLAGAFSKPALTENNDDSLASTPKNSKGVYNL